jgi:hypothetical protein
MMSYLEKIFEVGISDEYRWERIRYWRDKLLRDSDVKMISDAPWDKTTWAEYRQELRDLPSSVTDPSKIVFPSEPA